jgi:putative ABC transport system permease protein
MSVEETVPGQSDHLLPAGESRAAKSADFSSSSRRTLKLALRFSLREMRGGLSGFLIFLTCIALGVAAIGGVNSVARSITAGVAEEGQSLLGGDIRFELNQRQVTDAERTFLEGLGTLATTANMRSMARL